MKINTYTTSNYNKQSNTVNQSNIFLQTRNIGKDSITFGIYHVNYLDNSTSYNGEDEGDKLDKKLRAIETDKTSLNNQINGVNNQISTENSNHSKAIQEWNKKIDIQNTQKSELNSKINSLDNKISSQERKIGGLAVEKHDLTKSINRSQKENDKLKEAKDNISTQIQDNNKAAEKKRQKEIEEATIKNNEVFKHEVDNILSNPKSTLIETVLNPVKLERAGKDAIVPGGVLIESNPDEAKRAFEWLSKKSDSNYAILDANSSKSHKSLFNKISYIAKKSQKDFEKNKKRTFTFIENFETIGSLDSKNYRIIGALKNFLDTCSSDYHNTIVVSTKSVSKLDPILTADHRFQTKVPLDSKFLQKDEFGYKSMLKETEQAKTTGKKLKASPIGLMFSNLMKKIFVR